jgi:predicted ATPase
MKITRLGLVNWRNFKRADIQLTERCFIIGPNASGKSNLLDVFRFCRDLAKAGGGLQKAVELRGGLGKIRCLAARTKPDVEIKIEIEINGTTWSYEIGIRQEPRGHRQPQLTFERVSKNAEILVNRPDKDDKEDPARLTQTFLEQINANKSFRDLVNFFEKILYLHLVPQLLKHPTVLHTEGGIEDPFGVKFLERIMETPEKTRHSRLRKIQAALQLAVPELKQLSDTRDERGVPHLEALYEHWRPNAGKQREDQFSDGTLRLIGLLWSLLESDSLLLLEEPELSLHTAIVLHLGPLIWRMQRARKRQVLISTHSAELLRDPGIRPEEVVYLNPRGSEGTQVIQASEVAEIRALLDNGLSIAEVVLPRTNPLKVGQLSLFE